MQRFRSFAPEPSSRRVSGAVERESSFDRVHPGQPAGDLRGDEVRSALERPVREDWGTTAARSRASSLGEGLVRCAEAGQVGAVLAAFSIWMVAFTSSLKELRSICSRSAGLIPLR